MTEPHAGAIAGRIVHVSADYPDAVAPAKTRAIQSLVRLVEDRCDHTVISLNRRPAGAGFAARWLARPLRPRADIAVGEAADGCLPVVYRAPGKGLCHAGVLAHLGDWLADRLANGPAPALIVGHKLSVEGLAVREAARRLGVPYALSIQGDTDLKILDTRRDLRPALARVFHEAAVVFPFAPWALRRVEQRLGRRAGPSVVLPCPGTADRVLAPQVTGGGLMTAFHLMNWRRKNLPLMARATALLPGASLAVVGAGEGAALAACRRIAAAHAGVVLEGGLDHAAMPARMNRASGFVLPSRRESFGLVFIEALMAGTPILYPADWGVDGYFDGAPFALRVDNRSAGALAEAMARLLREEAALKAALAQWQASPAALRFQRAAIADAFAQGLALACQTSQEPS